MSIHGFKKYQGESRKFIMQNCRLHVNDSGSTFKLEKSNGKFVMTPFVKFGILEKLHLNMNLEPRVITMVH